MSRILFNPETSNISERGLKLRSIYYACIRKRDHNPNAGMYISPAMDGGVSPTGRRYKNNGWDSLAEKLEAEGIDVEPYVEYVLTRVKNLESPRQLTAQSFLDAYRSQFENQPISKRWEAEEDQIIKRAKILTSMYGTGPRVFSRILNDDMLGVSPLVRYSFAIQNNCDFLVSPRTKSLAYDQYLSRRFFYEKYYFDRIPPEFLESTKKHEKV